VKLVTIAGAGHVAELDEPEEVADAVHAFAAAGRASHGLAVERGRVPADQ